MPQYHFVVGVNFTAGLAPEIDLRKVMKAMKKVFKTNGMVLKDPDEGDRIQLQGDQREGARDFLLKYKLAIARNIKIMGF